MRQCGGLKRQPKYYDLRTQPGKERLKKYTGTLDWPMINKALLDAELNVFMIVTDSNSSAIIFPTALADKRRILTTLMCINKHPRFGLKQGITQAMSALVRLLIPKELLANVCPMRLHPDVTTRLLNNTLSRESPSGRIMTATFKGDYWEIPTSNFSQRALRRDDLRRGPYMFRPSLNETFYEPASLAVIIYNLVQTMNYIKVLLDLIFHEPTDNDKTDVMPPPSPLTDFFRENLQRAFSSPEGPGLYADKPNLSV